MTKVLVLSVCILATGCGSGATAPTETTTTTATTKTTPTATTSTGGLTMKMYSSSSANGPWISQTVTITGSDALGLVVPSPILMPDGFIAMYYLMSYVTGADPAAAQPNSQWKMGVATSTDNGVTFTHQATAFTFGSSTTDPFPLVLGNGLIRLLVSQGTNVPSVTATDASGLHFASAADSGFRVTTGGVPGALKVGSTYYVYGCGLSGLVYSTSTDGLTFTTGGSILSLGCDPSPIDAGGGTFLMAFKRGTGGGPVNDSTYMASSTDGKNWTDLGLVGQGSVPGLVKDKNGVLRIYVPGS